MLSLILYDLDFLIEYFHILMLKITYEFYNFNPFLFFHLQLIQVFLQQAMVLTILTLLLIILQVIKHEQFQILEHFFTIMEQNEYQYIFFLLYTFLVLIHLIKEFLFQ